MSISAKIRELKESFSSDLSLISEDKIDKDQIYNKYLGRKGLLNQLYQLLSQVDDRDKPAWGNKINEFKVEIYTALSNFGNSNVFIEDDSDLTLPPLYNKSGR